MNGEGHMMTRGAMTAAAAVLCVTGLFLAARGQGWSIAELGLFAGAGALAWRAEQ